MGTQEERIKEVGQKAAVNAVRVNEKRQFAVGDCVFSSACDLDLALTEMKVSGRERDASEVSLRVASNSVVYCLQFIFLCYCDF